MGYEVAEIRITARLSRHNDPDRDPVDDAKWKELRERVEAVVKEYEEDIDAFIV